MIKKEIPQYPDYAADTDGNIYSYRDGTERKLSARLHRGYLHVTVKDRSVPAKTHKEPVHKLVLNAFVGKRPDDYVCRHLNGHATDNRLENLCWGTVQENMQDEIRHGTAVCLRHGERAIASKLSLDDVLKIRWLYRFGYKQCELAVWFHINQRHVSDIVRCRTWKRDIAEAEGRS